jgi:hypothetical protein
MPIDYKLYPPNWKTEIVPRILNRAEHRCENPECGVQNYSMQWRGRKKVKVDGRYKNKVFPYNSEQEALDDGCTYFGISYYTWKKGQRGPIKHKEVGIYQVRIILTVAHLDHDSGNLEVTDDRLKALCQLCHLNYDAKMKYEKRINK